MEAPRSAIPSGLEITPLWHARIRWSSPIFGGLLGSLYCIATYLGCYQGWYWIELHNGETADFIPSPSIMAVMWALGAMAGGAIAGLFAEVGTPLAAAIVPLPLAAGAVFLVGRIEGLPSEALGWIMVDVVIILVGSGVGVLVGTLLRNQLSKAGAPGGI